jgi:hypothetical protein
MYSIVFFFGTKSAPIRVDVPDLAKMLFPNHMEQKIGTSMLASLVTSEFKGTYSDLECSELFCVHLLLSSVYDVDPFILDRYETKYPLFASLTGNNNINNYNSSSMLNGIRPVVTGVVGSHRKTIWSFKAHTMPNSQLPSVDFVLSLKQQSQRFSQRDQMLIHFNVSARNSHSFTSSVSCFNIYGNQKVLHKSKFTSKHQVIIDVSIIRDTVRPRRDVQPEDAASPIKNVFVGSDLVDVFGPNQTQITKFVYKDRTCAMCASTLFQCSIEDVLFGTCTYENSSSPITQCLRNEMASWSINPFLAETIGKRYSIDTSIHHCLNQLQVFDSDSYSDYSNNNNQHLFTNALKGLYCFASSKCPFGPLTTWYRTGLDQSKSVIFVSRFKLHHTILITGNEFIGHFEIQFGTSSNNSNNNSQPWISKDFTHKASEQELTQILIETTRGILSSNEISVRKTTSFDGHNSTKDDQNGNFNDQNNYNTSNDEQNGNFYEDDIDEAMWTSIEIFFSSVIYRPFTSIFVSNTSLFIQAIQQEEEQFDPSLEIFEANNSTSMMVLVEEEEKKNTCELCRLLMNPCRKSTQCVQVVQNCILPALTKSMSSFSSSSNITQLNVLPILHECINRSVSLAMEEEKEEEDNTWVVPIHSALLCYAKNSCLLGHKGFVTVPEKEQTNFYGNGTKFNFFQKGKQIFYLNSSCFFSLSDFKKPIFINFHTINRTFEHENLQMLSSFLKSFVLKNMQGKVIQTNKMLDNKTCEVTLEYDQFLENSIPEIFISEDDTDDTTTTTSSNSTMIQPIFVLEWEMNAIPSIDTLLEDWSNISSSSSSSSSPQENEWTITSSNNSIWERKSLECMQCFAKLQECSLLSVLSGQCTRKSPLLKCLNEKFPPQIFQALLDSTNMRNQSHGEDKFASSSFVSPSIPSNGQSSIAFFESGLSIEHEISACFKSVKEKTNSSFSSWYLNSLLGCYTATQCPFGPIQTRMTTNDSMIVLDTSAYIHLLHISASRFNFSFKYSSVVTIIDPSGSMIEEEESLISSKISSQLSKMTMQNVLEASVPGGISVEVVQLRPLGGSMRNPTAWLLEIHYGNVVLENFKVEIARQEFFFPDLEKIEQINFKAKPRLEVVPRPIASPSLSFTVGGVPSSFDLIQSSACLDCRNLLVHECQADRECSETVAPCMIIAFQSVEKNHNPSMNNSSRLDVSLVLRQCSIYTNASMSSWLPFQRFFICIAKNFCVLSQLYENFSTSNATLTATFLQIEKAEVQLEVSEMNWITQQQSQAYIDKMLFDHNETTTGMSWVEEPIQTEHVRGDLLDLQQILTAKLYGNLTESLQNNRSSSQSNDGI